MQGALMTPNWDYIIVADVLTTDSNIINGKDGNLP